MKDLEMSVSMNCSVCGNDQFSIVDKRFIDLKSAPDEAEVRCSDCGKITSKEQLIEDNRDKINANFEDLKGEAKKQLIKEIKKMFK